MTRALQDTLKKLQNLSGQHGEVLVAYSGGKDSLVTLDLCCRIFPRVKAFFLYRFPGISFLDAAIEYAEQRWGVQVVQYPHPERFYNLKHGIYCPWKPSYLELPECKAREMYDVVRREEGFSLLATGEREAEFRSRRLGLRNAKDPSKACPLKGWNKYDVLAYLAARKIPVPNTYREAGGVNMTTRSLLWLADNFPSDFEKVAAMYPFVMAVVKRRDWYGTGGE